jgi:hypothetical protein
MLPLQLHSTTLWDCSGKDEFNVNNHAQVVNTKCPSAQKRAMAICPLWAGWAPGVVCIKGRPLLKKESNAICSKVSLKLDPVKVGAC